MEEVFDAVKVLREREGWDSPYWLGVTAALGVVCGATDGGHVWVNSPNGDGWLYCTRCDYETPKSPR